MKIRCQEHYDKVAEYAKSIGDTTFQNCIGFAERTPDGRNGIVGGLLYHGRPDESFAVMIGGPFHGWSIHS